MIVLSSDVDRFFSKVLITPGCWFWTATKQRNGYGQFWFKKMVSAHRFSFEINVGPTYGMDVLHSCDNPGCVNPMHLRIGTHTENMQDKIARGRHRSNPNRGELHQCSKISEQNALEIKRRLRLGETQKSIAIDFGLDQSTISYIKSGRLWKHIEVEK